MTSLYYNILLLILNLSWILLGYFIYIESFREGSIVQKYQDWLWSILQHQRFGEELYKILGGCYICTQMQGMLWTNLFLLPFGLYNIPFAVFLVLLGYYITSKLT